MRFFRRSFLQASTGAVAMTLAGWPRPAWASDRVVLAVLGTGGMGRGHLDQLKSLTETGAAEIRYVCDADEKRLEQAAAIVPGTTMSDDPRRVLDDQQVDAVLIATPDHWHTPLALLALEAGKHVYVEKPCSHNVREGRLLVQASERFKRIVQHGTQSRSAPYLQQVVQAIREGVIGDVVVAKAWNIQIRRPIGRVQPSEPPAGFDYDLWLGPAPIVPFQSNRHHYTWHWWYDFGTGDAGNDGVHELDIARWGLGVDSHPNRVTSVGGKYVYDDDQQFPDTMTTVFEYTRKGERPKQLIFELRLWTRNAPYGMDNANEFLGTKGRIVLTKRGRVDAVDAEGRKLDLVLKDVGKVAHGPHHANFLAAIRGETSIATGARESHLSAALPHLANLGCRIGRGFDFDPVNESIPGDSAAHELLGRKYREGHWATPHLS